MNDISFQRKEILKKVKDKTEKLDSLKKDLNKAIEEERYEDAAKIRDKIKEIENKAK